MGNIRFEEIGEEHLQEVLDIYNYYVLNTTATFHDHALSPEEMKQLVYFDSPVYRTYVIYDKQDIAGYVILTRYKVREAYRRTAEVTIYLKPDETGKGIGRAALGYIESYAKTVGIHALIASICGQNSKSIHLFIRCGYFECAHYKEVGMKFGQILDTVAYEKILN